MYLRRRVEEFNVNSVVKDLPYTQHISRHLRIVSLFPPLYKMPLVIHLESVVYAQK